MRTIFANMKQCIFIPLTLSYCLSTMFHLELQFPEAGSEGLLPRAREEKREHEIKSSVSSIAKIGGEICEIA